MKKENIWFVAACALFFIGGYTMNDVAISLPRYKVAVVDITKVMEQSKDIKTLKATQDKQLKELETLISKAQNEIANTQDEQKAIQLQANYSKQIEAKRNTIDEEYSKKIVQITSNIKNLIATQAKKTDYNLVLPTGMVISGGDDITENVLKEMP
ncbi:OmpH family outer membrane protein [bacterium]|nr:OmpH family outer membrane protein [bacterium]MBP3846558.1 OmpH family outer membrane protein [bacterium]